MRFNYLGKCARDTGWLQKMRQFVMSVFGWVTVREPRCVGTSILHDFSTSFQYDL
jgi:hypothetical protein